MLVKLTTTNNEVVFVNPANVSYLRTGPNPSETIVYFNNVDNGKNYLFVSGNISNIADRLGENDKSKKEFNYAVATDVSRQLEAIRNVIKNR